MLVQEWYSGRLIQHGADILDAVLPVARASNSSDNGSSPTVSCSKRRNAWNNSIYQRAVQKQKF